MALTQLRIVPDAQLPALLHSDPWLAASEDQRRVAQWRHQLIAPALALMDQGASLNHAAELLAVKIVVGNLDTEQRLLTAQLASDARKIISMPTIKRWIAAYKRDGKTGLLTKHTGRVRKDAGWEAQATALFNLPSKPSYAAVALKLRKEGFETATDSRVKRYLKSLPATLGQNSPQRVGRNLHKLQRSIWKQRDRTSLEVGEVYAGDGHTIDCYVAHPNTGGLYRPELTAFIDIRSAYITGWYLSEAESALSTLFALSSSMVTHDHVPAALYLDRGAGYRGKLMNHETTGFYARFSMSVIAALPGNPHGKGWIERWFRTVREHHDKFFYGGMVYCGGDMAQEVNRRLSVDIKNGKRKVPSLKDYEQSLANFIDEYNHTPMPALDGKTPAQVWADLQKVSVELPTEAIIRPREIRKIQKRHIVELHKRIYWHESLSLYEQGTDIHIEYDLHNDQQVWLFESSGRFICAAQLQETRGIVDASRLEEMRTKRLSGQVTRIAQKHDEALARAQDCITVDAQLQGLASMTSAPRLADRSCNKKRNDEIVLNLLGDD
ncbi:Mu transposase C-terminal domain-containing protein [Collimonas antrihumi]|uniref:Mu transposase C-terminal domain-containing protein n=1 Tax=Collimonas antrihumi TaxID=1940615 RepID=UPI001B8CBFD3|nr:Mu transposase C-terminal domain-containing protein [Collimonas antrihumi]